MAVLVKAVLICAAVSDGRADFNKAAIAAACGAAAEVPKKGEPNPPTPVTFTPSAAVTSGFCNNEPPVDRKFPGVTAELSALKKIRRGPSELNVSTVFDAMNGDPVACTAATQ
jgi:hypothetical protein